jgi:hypothetical protein
MPSEVELLRAAVAELRTLVGELRLRTDKLERALRVCHPLDACPSCAQRGMVTLPVESDTEWFGKRPRGGHVRWCLACTHWEEDEAGV